MNEGVMMSAQERERESISWAKPFNWIIFVAVYMNSSVISALLKSCHLWHNKYQFAIFQFVGIGPVPVGPRRQTTAIFNSELAV